MKKYIALLLSFAMLLSMSSCNLYEKIFPILTLPEPTIPDVTTPNETTPQLQETTTEPEETTTEPKEPENTPNIEETPTDELPEDAFGYYHGIFEAYCLAIERFDLIHENAQTIYKEMELDDLEKAEAFQKLLKCTYDFYPYDDRDTNVTTPEKLDYFRYTEYDLNGDETKELIFLTKDYQILAIYSGGMYDSVLLGTFAPGDACWIDSEGRIHINDHSVYKIQRVYEIAPGGKKLNLLAEYGQDAVGYFEKVDGERKKINYSKFDELNKEYGKYRSPSEAAETTRDESGLRAAPLYSQWHQKLPETMYRPALNGDEQVLLQKTGEMVYLKDYIPAGGEVSLAKCDTLRYIYYDVDEDDVIDVAIDCGSEKLCLTYHNGTVILSSLSVDIWEAIEENDFWYVYDICTLGAPWREKVMSLQEIQAIASFAFRIEDGESTGACGTLIVYRLLVSDEPDEDGYYLVTLREEYYHRCEFECCPDDGSEYHLTSFRDSAYMLVHERTGEVLYDARTSLVGAQKLAGEYWGIADGQVIYGSNKTFVVHILVKDDPNFTNAFYHVFLQIEYYQSTAYENGEPPYEVKTTDSVYIRKDDGSYYTYPDLGGK